MLASWLFSHSTPNFPSSWASMPTPSSFLLIILLQWLYVVFLWPTLSLLSFLTLLLLLAPDQVQSTTFSFYSGFLQMFLTVPSLTSTVKTIYLTIPWSSHVFSVYIWDWNSQFTHLQVCLCCDPMPMTQGQCFLLYNTYSIIFLLPLIEVNDINVIYII